MGREWFIPLAIVGLIISGCTSPVPSASSLETPRPDAVGTALADLGTVADETGTSHNLCGGSLTAGSNPLCTGTNPTNPDSIDLKKAVEKAQRAQVKFKDGGFQMGELHPAIKALIENAPQLVNYIQGAEYTLIDDNGGVIMGEGDQFFPMYPIPPDTVPVFQDLDYQQIVQSGVREADVMVGSGQWVFYDTKSSNGLVIAYDKAFVSGSEFVIEQNQPPISNVVLVGKDLDVSEIDKLARVKDFKFKTAYIVSPNPDHPEWQDAIYAALDRGVLEKAVVLTADSEQYKYPSEIKDEKLLSGVYEIGGRYLLQRATKKVGKDFPFGSWWFGPEGAYGRISKNGRSVVWWTEITRKK